MVIGDEILVTVMAVNGHTVRLGIEAPQGVSVYREKIWLAVKEENRAAADAAADALPAAPVAMPAEQALDSPAEQALDSPAEQALDSPAEQALDSPTEQALDSPTEQALDSPGEQAGPAERAETTEQAGPAEQAEGDPP